jgi:hypothetical protein
VLGLVLLLVVNVRVNVSSNHDVNGGAHDDVNGIVLVVSGRLGVAFLSFVVNHSSENFGLTNYPLYSLSLHLLGHTYCRLFDILFFKYNNYRNIKFEILNNNF